jgi:hypothetical protein
MRTTRVSEARHHGLPGSLRCPRRLPLGREAATGGHGGTRGGGANLLPKVEVEDGEVMPAQNRPRSVCEICVRAGDAVVPCRGPGSRHGCLPPGCSVGAREDGYAVRPVQLGPANSLADEVDRGKEKDEVPGLPAPVAPGAGEAGPTVLLQGVGAGSQSLGCGREEALALSVF